MKLKDQGRLPGHLKVMAAQDTARAEDRLLLTPQIR